MRPRVAAIATPGSAEATVIAKASERSGVR